MDEIPRIPPLRRRRAEPLPPAGPHRPDALEKGIRFGCGALLGGLLVASFAFYELIGFRDDPGRAWIAVGVAALVSGVVAVRFGDRAFEVLFSLFHWR